MSHFCGFCKFQFAVRIKGRGAFKLIVNNDFPIVKSTDAEIVMERKIKTILRPFFWEIRLKKLCPMFDGASAGDLYLTRVGLICKGTGSTCKNVSFHVLYINVAYSLQTVYFSFSI